MYCLPFDRVGTARVHISFHDPRVKMYVRVLRVYVCARQSYVISSLEVSERRGGGRIDETNQIHTYIFHLFVRLFFPFHHAIPNVSYNTRSFQSVRYTTV